MTTKTTVSFTDRHHKFVKSKVEEGSFASMSSVIASGIEQLMQQEEEREIALRSMAYTIQQRMETPRENWVALESDDLFSRAQARIENQVSPK